jgi:hypothetical protein
VDLIAAPLLYAPLAWPDTAPVPALAVRPARSDGGQPVAAVLLVEIEIITLEAA